MFGRVRAPSSSPDSLQRPPSKIIKDDPLSIYEATLMKLKLGSQHQHNLSPESVLESNVRANPLEISEIVSSNEDAMTTETDNLSDHVSPVSCYCRSQATPKQHGNRDVSILYLFSKFKSSQKSLRSSHEADDSLSNTSVSTISSCINSQ